MGLGLIGMGMGLGWGLMGGWEWDVVSEGTCMMGRGWGGACGAGRGGAGGAKWAGVAGLGGAGWAGENGAAPGGCGRGWWSEAQRVSFPL